MRISIKDRKKPVEYNGVIKNEERSSANEKNSDPEWSRQA